MQNVIQKELLILSRILKGKIGAFYNHHNIDVQKNSWSQTSEVFKTSEVFSELIYLNIYRFRFTLPIVYQFLFGI